MNVAGDCETKNINWKLKIDGYNDNKPFVSNFRPIKGDIIKLPNRNKRQVIQGVFFDFENEIITFG